MLFENSVLKSKYDFGNELPDKLSNLTSLAKEIYKQTDLIYSLYEEGEIIYFHHTDNNGNNIIVDFNQVSEKTWSRDVAEIKEILYRLESSEGKDQPQFSISKSLKKMNVYEPEDFNDYKNYLQVLYFFYMMNYFAFPNVNIFKKLSDHNMNYNSSYDEGTTGGIYLSFIAANIFDNQETLNEFITETNSLNEIQECLAECLKYVYTEYNISNEIVYKFNDFKSKPSSENSVIKSFIYFIYSYAMKSYCYDLLNNLNEEDNIFYFDELDIPPFDDWKTRYIDVENINEFLNENQVYWFCKQVISKIESRDKHKFLESNAVKFLKEFIKYDQQWTDIFNANEGIFIEIREGKQMIYALRIACIIKTYNDLINKQKIRIISGIKNKQQPLRTILSNNVDIYPATLAIRYFILACHSQYLNAIMNHEEYKRRYLKEFIHPEKVFLEIVHKAYLFHSFEECYDYLYQCVIELQNFISQI